MNPVLLGALLRLAQKQQQQALQPPNPFGGGGGFQFDPSRLQMQRLAQEETPKSMPMAHDYFGGAAPFADDANTMFAQNVTDMNTSGANATGGNPPNGPDEYTTISGEPYLDPELWSSLPHGWMDVPGTQTTPSALSDPGQSGISSPHAQTSGRVGWRGIGDPYHIYEDGTSEGAIPTRQFGRNMPIIPGDTPLQQYVASRSPNDGQPSSLATAMIRLALAQQQANGQPGLQAQWFAPPVQQPHSTLTNPFGRYTSPGLEVGRPVRIPGMNSVLGLTGLFGNSQAPAPSPLMNRLANARRLF